MHDPAQEPQATPPQPEKASSELERTLEDLHLEPTLQELHAEQADQIRGGELTGMMGMSGMSGMTMKKTPLF